MRFIFIVVWIWCNWWPCIGSFMSFIFQWKEEGIQVFTSRSYLLS